VKKNSVQNIGRKWYSFAGH